MRFRLEDYDKAESAYRAVLALGEKAEPALRAPREARFWLGMIALARGKTTLGTRQILKAAQESKDFREAFSYKFNLAEILRKVGAWDQALGIYDEILPLAQGEECVTIDYSRAEIMDRLGKRSDAIILLRDILSRQPGLLPAEVSLMDLELKDGRWREVKQRLAELIEAHGRLPVLAAYEQQIAMQESLAAKEPEKTAQAIDAKTLLRLGRENLDAQDWGRAIAVFKDAFVAAEAARENEEALIALRQLARSLRGAGRTNEAASVLRKACARAPDDVRFLKDIGDLFARSSASAQDAIVTYTRLATVATDSASKVEALLALGELLERQGAAEEAATWYDRAAAAGTIPLDAHRRCGELWEAAGNSAKARAAYEAYLAVEENPDKRRAVEDRLKTLPSESAQ
jgi:tetratricopeptide (TPR) repeat protein